MDKRLKHVLEGLCNVKFNELQRCVKSLSLYNHWLLHFDDMHSITKRGVLLDMKKEAEGLSAFNLSEEDWEKLLEECE